MDLAAFATAFSGTLAGGGIVVFLLRDRLQQQAQLRQDHAALKREVEQDHAKQIEQNQLQITRLSEANVRQQERLATAMEKLASVDFGALKQQIHTMGRQVEELVHAERQETNERARVAHELRTLAARVDRAHEKVDQIKQHGCNHGCNHG